MFSPTLQNEKVNPIFKMPKEQYIQITRFIDMASRFHVAAKWLTLSFYRCQMAESGHHYYKILGSSRKWENEESSNHNSPPRRTSSSYGYFPQPSFSGHMILNQWTPKRAQLSSLVNSTTPSLPTEKSQNISSWKRPIRIIESNSLLLAGLPNTKP